MSFQANAQRVLVNFWLSKIKDEVERARELHPPYNSNHEAYAVLLEEVDEYWDEVRKKSQERNPKAMAEELVQIAAVATCALVELFGDVDL